MNATIDIGNTEIKVALFKDNLLLEYYHHNHFESILKFLTNKNILHIIVSSVRDLEIETSLIKLNPISISYLTHTTPLPIHNSYKSPETLGMDRLANSLGANYLFPSKNVLIIDAGTCITYDFLNDRQTYIGGSISPGLEMRYKAMAHFTSKLPYIVENDFDSLIGTSTNECLQSGVKNGLLAELEGIIARYKSLYFDISVLVCGGDSSWLASKIGDVLHQPQLMLIGLNQILQYNLSKKS